MKQFLFVFLIAFALTANAQDARPLYWVHTVKPVKGKAMAFEAAYKQHVARFHKTDKVTVYEILTGKWAGYYHVVSATTYADLDKERDDNTAHGIDLDKNFNAYLEDDEMSEIFAWVDSLSYKPEVTADKFIVNVRHLKRDLNMGDFRREMARTTKIWATFKSAFWDNASFSYFEQLWDGSENIVVQIRNLKDGFKSLERGFYPPPPAGSINFREQYVKMYGFDAWDERVKLFEGSTVSNDQYIMKLRQDLSSQ